jgi:hypothetical protein
MLLIGMLDQEGLDLGDQVSVSAGSQVGVESEALG